MIRYLRLWTAFFRNCLARELEYRGHIIMQFLLDLTWYSVQVALFEVLYLNTHSIAGMDHGEMLVFLGTLFITDAVNEMFFSHNFSRFPKLVAAGELDFYLIKPVSTYFISFTRHMLISSWLNLAIGLGVLLYGMNEVGLAPAPQMIALYIVMVVCGNTILLSLQAAVAAIAVFLVQADGIQHVFYTLYQFAMKPDAIYSRWMRRILLFVFPLALVASVPSRALLGTLTPDLAVLNIGGAFVLFFVSKWFFSWSLKHYSGASA